MPEVEFEFHAQRSPVVLDRLRSGEYMVGICTGTSDADTDLVSEVIRREPMVILPSGLSDLRYRTGDPLDVITIESRSGAWQSIEDDMGRLNLRRRESLESFFAVAQMGVGRIWDTDWYRQGFAGTLGVSRDDWIDLTEAGLTRPVRFVARKSMFSQPPGAELLSGVFGARGPGLNRHPAPACQQGDPVRRVIQARYQGELAAACVQKPLPTCDADLLQCFEIVGNKGRTGDDKFAHAFGRQRLEYLIRVWGEPGQPTQSRLEAD